MEPVGGLRVYLDTSVFSARFDDRTPERRQATEIFLSRLPEFRAATSDLAREELSAVVDAGRRQALLALLAAVRVYPVTEEMGALAREYVAENVFVRQAFADALHVAAAVLTRQDVLVSWNFRHLVNRRGRIAVNEANAARGLPPIDIVSPPEL